MILEVINKMDRVEAILINAYQYERTQVMNPSNNKAPTWWPHIVREYDAQKWSTSPDPDSYPVDGIWELPKLGNKDIYDWVSNEILEKLLTGNEKKTIYAFLGPGYRLPLGIASKILHLKPQSAINQYNEILLKIKNSIPNDILILYFKKI